MGHQILQPPSSDLWALGESQHGVVARAQLLDVGLTPEAIKHRIAKGRLHPVWRGVYAVGRPQLSRYGTWTAAVLSCGPEAVLSHGSAAALWRIGEERRGEIEISVPAGVARRRPGIVVHRRARHTSFDLTRHHGIPVTNPVRTLVDLAACLRRDVLESAVNEADKRDLTDPETLRRGLASYSGQPGATALRAALDRRTFTLTDSELERRFLPVAREAGLPPPQTGRYVNGFKVDFYWPELGLIVETDGLRYHRTAAQQSRDRLRDQVHTAAGLTPLRFTRAQVRFEPGHVRATLSAVAHRLGADRGGP